MSARILRKPYTQDVQEFRDALATLARWIVDDGGSTGELLDAIEKPWRWEDEAATALALAEAIKGWDQ